MVDVGQVVVGDAGDDEAAAAVPVELAVLVPLLDHPDGLMKNISESI